MLRRNILCAITAVLSTSGADKLSKDVKGKLSPAQSTLVCQFAIVRSVKWCISLFYISHVKSDGFELSLGKIIIL